MADNTPRKIKVIFENNTWEFDYNEDFQESHFRKVLAPSYPEIASATVSTRLEENGTVKVFEFKKSLKYKG